ncbi:malate dehydrogenase [Candidatus Geothermarchaeota archaeon ex4572_27]|nr:MAG: malate dehydrogenase [Candidatus Geothermarchaeota archaeon ex4572_27]
MAEKKPTVEELLEKAKKPAKLAPPLHKFYQGKIQVMPKCAVRGLRDFDVWYTPGVAEPCKIIKDNPDASFEYTNRWNYAAVVSDGSRVLGLGNIGGLAGLPVMEGKALLFKYLGGVDAFPLVVKTQDPDELLKFLEWIEPTFGAINLEDIAKPKCFYVLEEARKRLEIPVWHDDQQGTATVVLAALINALKVVGKKLNEVLIALIGAGAANIKVADVLVLAGAKPGNLILVDSKGILTPDRAEKIRKEEGDRWKAAWAEKSNAEGRTGGIPEAMKGADVVIGMSRPGPGVIKKEWVAQMADNAIVFACANPIPEIWPWEAKEAGARIVATGRSDFPNQVNNSLGFPAIFRGVLDVRAKTITDEMCVAAAKALAEYAEEKGIHEEYIIPTMEEWEVYPREAVACALHAIKQGVARIRPSKQELWERAVSIIKQARESLEVLMKAGLIKPPPPEEEILTTYTPK